MQYQADAAKIRRWREERHWSQDHLAALAGIGVRTLQRIETGESASRDSLKALAAAFEVDVMALTVDAKLHAAEMVEQERARGLAALRLSFWIHLASYILGVIIFTGISIGIGGERFTMLWPLIWWTVGMAGHAVTVVIVTLVWRYDRQFRSAE